MQLDFLEGEDLLPGLCVSTQGFAGWLQSLLNSRFASDVPAGDVQVRMRVRKQSASTPLQNGAGWFESFPIVQYEIAVRCLCGACLCVSNLPYQDQRVFTVHHRSNGPDFRDRTVVAKLIYDLADHVKQARTATPEVWQRAVQPLVAAPQPPPPEASKEAMSEKILERVPTLTAAKKALVHGGKVAAADEVGETLVDIAKQTLGEHIPAAVFDSPGGRAVIKAGMAMLLHYGEGKFFEAPGLRTAAELQMEAAARDLIQPNLKKIKPKLDKLAAIGKKIEE